MSDKEYIMEICDSVSEELVYVSKGDYQELTANIVKVALEYGGLDCGVLTDKIATILNECRRRGYDIIRLWVGDLDADGLFGGEYIRDGEKVKFSHFGAFKWDISDLFDAKIWRSKDGKIGYEMCATILNSCYDDYLMGEEYAIYQK